MKLLRFLLLLLLAAGGLHAQAQRTLVPIVSFENIPVTVATSTRVTAEQVRKAFADAAEELQWQLAPVGEGVMDATYVKGNKHTIVVTIRYDAEKYSALFKSSHNMKQLVQQYPNATATVFSSESTGAAAERKQRALFEGRPESRYVKSDPNAVIHPFYEHWLQELLLRVRLNLKRNS
jgi:hypothetical protein